MKDFRDKAIEFTRDKIVKDITDHLNHWYKGIKVEYKNNSFIVSGTNEENIKLAEKDINEMLRFSVVKDLR